MKDIFGKALYDYWKGDHKTTCIIRRDDGYTDINRLGNYFTRKQFPVEKKVVQWAYGKVLDGGCVRADILFIFRNAGSMSRESTSHP